MRFKLIVFLLMVFSYASAQELTKTADVAFKVGEQLNYKLKYGFFTGAEAHLRVEESETKFNGKPAYHIIAEGNTAGTFDVFYKVRNRYETFIDKTTLLPYLYTENRHEGSWSHTDRVSFDHATGKITAKKGTYSFQGQMTLI